MKPIDINTPLPGYYKTRLVKGGPYVPARIFRTCCCTVNGGEENAEHPWRPSCDRFPPLRGEINGEERNPFDIWSRLAKHPITKADFHFMTDTRKWAEAHSPLMPEADPRRSIDLNTIPPMF